MHLRQKTVWSAHPMGKTGSKKSRSIKCFASTVTNQLFCPLASSLIHECVRAHAVILLWAGFNVLVQSGTAEGSHRSLLRGVFILTRLTERHIKPQTSHSSNVTFFFHCSSVFARTSIPFPCSKKIFSKERKQRQIGTEIKSVESIKYGCHALAGFHAGSQVKPSSGQ